MEYVFLKALRYGISVLRESKSMNISTEGYNSVAEEGCWIFKWIGEVHKVGQQILKV